VIAARWAVLALATGLLLAVIGSTAIDVPASEQRVLIASVIAVLAPLCWPGCADVPGRTAVRIGLWAAAATALAAILQRLLGPSGQPLPAILETCAMLLPILLLTHAASALIETRLRLASADPTLARDAAARMAATGLALLGALPLWLGPVAELLSARVDGLIDAIVGISPLTHLALASGNDLLRTAWLYEHANLAALPVTYPALAPLAWCYGGACLAVAISALAWRPACLTVAAPSRTPLITEKPQ
jgi:hypothetical protein